MSLSQDSAVEECEPKLTREECACILEREYESVVEDIKEHPNGQNFVERLVARLPAECIALLLKCDLLEPRLDV